MPSGIQLSSGVVVGQPVPLDAKYGPYNTTALALADLSPSIRYQGLTVGIKSGASIVEYWFKDGVSDANFIVKGSAGAVSWTDITNKPSTFTPSPHTHTILEVSGLQNQLDNRPLPNEYYDLEIYSDDSGNPDVVAVPVGNGTADITVFVDNPNGVQECYGQVQLPMVAQKVGRQAFITRVDQQLTATFLSVPLTQGQLQSQSPPAGVPAYIEIDYPSISSGTLPGSVLAFTWMGDAWAPVVRRIGQNNPTLNGYVSISKADVGLSNVNNTSDLNKPISTATQTALNGKAAVSHTHTALDITNLVSNAGPSFIYRYGGTGAGQLFENSGFVGPTNVGVSDNFANGSPVGGYGFYGGWDDLEYSRLWVTPSQLFPHCNTFRIIALTKCSTVWGDGIWTMVRSLAPSSSQITIPGLQAFGGLVGQYNAVNGLYIGISDNLSVASYTTALTFIAYFAAYPGVNGGYISQAQIVLQGFNL